MDGYVEVVLNDGARQVPPSAGDSGFEGTAPGYRAIAREFSRHGAPGALAQPGIDPPAKAFVDFQSDVTTRDLVLAAREGLRVDRARQALHDDRNGTDQGKTSGHECTRVRGGGPRSHHPPQVGLTTFRMPYTPVTFGSFAGYDRGNLFDPVRTTPTHDWALAHGAVFEDVGQWKRARYFPRPGEDMHAAVARECLAVRSASACSMPRPSARSRWSAPTPRQFLSRLYVNDFANLAVGRSRYGVLLRDDGFVYDDGVIARSPSDRFHVTTTTGGAARVFGMMEDYLQTEWPDLGAG